MWSRGATAFALALAAAARSRAQLNGLRTIIILIMSTIGGSMIFRFLMPPLMQKFGLLTFNAWAIDGFRKVFWFQDEPWELWPQVSVRVMLIFAFLWLARLLARRWEVA